MTKRVQCLVVRKESCSATMCERCFSLSFHSLQCVFYKNIDGDKGLIDD